MHFHLFEIPLREGDGRRAQPKLVLYLVGRGKNASYLPLSLFCKQLNHVFEQQGCTQVKVSISDILFGLRSNHWRRLERKHQAEG